MIEVKPDGKIVIEFVDSKAIRVVNFQHITGHKPEEFGFRIEFPDHREIIPWHRIKSVNVYFNSPGYIKELQLQNMRRPAEEY